MQWLTRYEVPQHECAIDVTVTEVYCLPCLAIGGTQIKNRQPLITVRHVLIFMADIYMYSLNP